MSPAATLSPVKQTRPRSESSTHTYYSEILGRVKKANLLTKNPNFYINRLIIITLLSLTAWAGVWVTNLFLPFWGAVAVTAGIALILGVLSAQYGFIAHEAAHKQVFHGKKTNEWAGRILANLFAGLSYGFWIRKHTRHHNKPNQINYDPDINIRVLSFTTESLENKKGPEKLLSKNQGWLFPILLFFTGFDLLLDSVVSITQKNSPVQYKTFETVCMIIRQVTPFALFYLFTGNPVLAGIYWFVMMCSFGFFMGSAFAPNHKGRPLIPEGSKIGYFERQVFTSRNVKSNWFTDNFMGGLNFQIEHHLFPSMPRPNLRLTNKLVKEFCAEKGISFYETTWPQAFKEVVVYLNKVGLSNNANPFDCPLVNAYRM